MRAMKPQHSHLYLPIGAIVALGLYRRINQSFVSVHLSTMVIDVNIMLIDCWFCFTWISHNLPIQLKVIE